MKNFDKENSIEYIEKTINTDLSEQHAFFEKYLKPNCSILDVGFGSARDMLYFKHKGYKVSGIDLEEGFVNHALELGLDVKQANVLDFKTNKKYDAIWCCASLVHFTLEKMKVAINNLRQCLNKDGIIYISLKYGDFEGYIEDRYFTFINEEKLKLLNLNIIDKTITKSVTNRNLYWLNLIIK